MLHREPELSDDTQEGVQDCPQVGTQYSLPSNFPLKKHLHDHPEAVLPELSQNKLSSSSEVTMSDSSKERFHLIHQGETFF